MTTKTPDPTRPVDPLARAIALIDATLASLPANPLTQKLIADLKKELRGGEVFNYGVGSLRAKFTPEFKSLDAVRKAKGRLTSAADFEKLKAEVNAEFDKLIADGHVPGKTRPLMGYRTAASMQQHAREAGLQMTAAIGARRAQQRAAVEQLLLAWA